MDKNLRTAAIGITVLIIFGYFFFQYTVHENVPGENMHRLASSYLEEGNYDKALKNFDEVLAEHPEYKEAHLGRAITLMQSGDPHSAMNSFDRALAIDKNFAAAYANRGILNDRVGNYEQAVSDYRKAVELDPEMTEGPGLIWRFLRNVSERPPTLIDRADYIEEELKKPASERLLSVPEIDAEQRMYKK